MSASSKPTLSLNTLASATAMLTAQKIRTKMKVKCPMLWCLSTSTVNSQSLIRSTHEKSGLPYECGLPRRNMAIASHLGITSSSKAEIMHLRSWHLSSPNTYWGRHLRLLAKGPALSELIETRGGRRLRMTRPSPHERRGVKKRWVQAKRGHRRLRCRWRSPRAAEDEEDEGFDEDIEARGEPMMTSASGPAADISGGLAVIHLM